MNRGKVCKQRVARAESLAGRVLHASPGGCYAINARHNPLPPLRLAAPFWSGLKRPFGRRGRALASTKGDGAVAPNERRVPRHGKSLEKRRGACAPRGAAAPERRLRRQEQTPGCKRPTSLPCPCGSRRRHLAGSADSVAGQHRPPAPTPGRSWAVGVRAGIGQLQLRPGYVMAITAPSTRWRKQRSRACLGHTRLLGRYRSAGTC